MNRFSYLTDRYEPTDEVKVRDHVLLESASARPMAALAGADAYPSLEDKAAALPRRNHALMDGNKRLALAGTIAFLGVNGRRAHYVQRPGVRPRRRRGIGELDDVSTVADHIKRGTKAR